MTHRNPEARAAHLLRGGGMFLAARVVNQGSNVITAAVIARVASPATFAAYAIAFSVVTFLSVVAMLGLENTAVREIAAALAGEERGRAAAVTRGVYRLGATGIVLVGLAALVTGPWALTHALHVPDLAGLAAWIVAWTALVALNQLQAAMLRGAHRLGTAALLDGTIRSVLTLVLVVALALTGSVSLVAALAVSTGAALVSALIGAVLLSRWRVSLGVPEGQVPARLWGDAWPIMVSTILGFGLQQADLWFASAFVAAGDVARYAAVARLSFLTTLPLTVLNSVVGPSAADLYHRGDHAGLQSTLRGGATVATAAALPAVLLFVAAGAPLLGLLYGEFYRAGAMVLAVLTLGRIVNVATGPCGLALMMAGRQRVQLAVTVVNAILVVAGAAWAGPRWGGLGIAWVYGGAMAASNVVMVFVARRTLGVWTQASWSPALFTGGWRLLRSRVA